MNPSPDFSAPGAFLAALSRAESRRRRANTTASAPARRRPPGCLEMSLTPRRRHLAHKCRELSGIDPALRECLRGLCHGDAPWPLYLWGPAGVGKTCASLVALDYALAGLYWTVQTLAEDAVLAGKGQLEYRSGRPVSSRALWAEAEQTGLVVLDELGQRARASDWQYDCVKRLLDAREGLPLIAASNMDLSQVAQCYDDRVASRLAAGTVFHLGGEDRRLARPK
jgi:DNA replication protein DnaC